MTDALQLILFASHLFGLGLTTEDAGRLSVYRPGDGNCGSELACGGLFTRSQRHIAYRKWWKVGCGRVVLVHAEATNRWAVATVQDAGPYGAYKGRLEAGGKMLAEGRYRVASRRERRRGRLRTGWKWRGVTDLSWGLWRALGRPAFLSHVRLYFFPWRQRAAGAYSRRRQPQPSS